MSFTYGIPVDFLFFVFQNVDEKCTYSPSPSDKNMTVCERQAWVASSVFGLSFAIQAFAFERYKKNVTQAASGFEHILREKWPEARLAGSATTPTSTDPDTKSRNPQKTVSVAKACRVPVLPSCTGGGTT